MPHFRFLLLAAGLVGLAGAPAPVTPSRAIEVGSFPFRVGERLTYQAKVNFLPAGAASMSVEGIETVRGRSTYHTIFDVRGHVLFFLVNDHYESWFDTTTLVSLHHTQHIEQGSRKDDR